jgi:hypothetical protein
VLTAWASIIGTVIVARPFSTWLTRWVDQVVNRVFRMVASSISDYRRRDRVLAAQAATILIAQLAAWLAIAFLGFALMLWPFDREGITSAFTSAGSSMFTLGFEVPISTVPAAIVFIAAATGLVIVALQIAYLPALYAAFNRRETEVALLNARAGVPSWGPSCWPARTTRWARAYRPSTRCQICTGSGNAGPPTSRRATPPICHWSGSARPGRFRPG